MKTITVAILTAFATLLTESRVAIAQTTAAPDLSGLWAAKVRYGPDIRGLLVILKHGSRWEADIAAGGNGGQVFMAIPDLDLVFAFTGGNYAQQATFTSQRVFVPQYILPAVN